jgi:hypothetical protein
MTSGFRQRATTPPDRALRGGLVARLLPALLAVLAVCATAALAGCLGGGGSEDPDDVIAKTFRGEGRIKSGKLNLDLSARLEGVPQLSGPVTLKMSGPFQSLGGDEFPQLDLDLSASAAGQNFRAGAVSTGEKGFFSFQGTDYVVPDAQFERIKREIERAQRESEDSKQPDLGALGVHPREWLKDPTDEGTEDVAGTETIHIAGDVDVAKLLEDVDDLLKRANQLGLSQQQQQQLPEAIPPAAKKQIVDAVKEAKLDLFTGKDDKILRKIEVSLKFEVPEDLRDDVQGLRSGDIDFSLEIADLNERQTIKEPTRARPLRELQRQLSGLGGLGGGTSGGSGGGSGGSGGDRSGGSSGGGSSGGGSSGSGSGGGSELGSRGGNVDRGAATRYLRCVEKASGNEELRECAELLR